MARKPILDRPFDSDRPVYDRQSWESPTAYAHFQAYARLPYLPENRHTDGRPGPRTLHAVADAGDVSLSTIKTHSSEKRWADRAAAYDAAQATEERRAIQEAERHARNTAARRKMKATDELWTLFETLVDRAREAVAFPLYDESEPELIEGADGQALYSIVRTPLENLTAAGVGSYLREARMFFGAVFSNTGGELDDIADRIDYDALTDEQQQRIIDGEHPVLVALSGLAIARRAGEGEGPGGVGEEQATDG